MHLTRCNQTLYHLTSWILPRYTLCVCTQVALLNQNRLLTLVLGGRIIPRYIGRDLCFVRARVVWCVYKKRPLYWDLLRLYITWHIEPEQTLTHLAVEYSSVDTFEVSFFALTRGHDISSAQVEG